MNPGDIVKSPTGRYWRVLHVQQTIIRARDVDTGVVSRLDREAVRVVESHPGGRK